MNIYVFVTPVFMCFRRNVEGCMIDLNSKMGVMIMITNQICVGCWLRIIMVYFL